MNTGVTNFAGETAVNFENVYTGAGSDKIIGTDANNSINTGAGDDLIDGGAGFNTSTGGAGHDTFVVSSSGYVAIQDFQLGVDRIKLGGLNSSDIKFTNFNGSVFINNGVNSFAQLAGVTQGNLSDANFLKLITG